MIYLTTKTTLLNLNSILHIMKPITSLINFLNLPPNQSSINILSTIHHIHYKQFTIYYISHNNQLLLIHSFNHFSTLNQPIKIHLTYHPDIQSILNTF